MSAAVHTFKDSSAQTGSNSGSWIALNTATMLSVGVDILTGGSGTITDFDVWMEGSDVGGSDAGYKMPADLIHEPTPATQVNRLEIVNNETTPTLAERWSATYKHWPWKFARAAWKITGTSPSIPFRVIGCSK